MSSAMKKTLLYTAIVFGVVFGWYGIRQLLGLWFILHYQPPAVAVEATTATAENWRSSLTAVGNLKAINGVDISTEVSGKVTAIHFNSGQQVKQGELIVELNTQPEQAELKNNLAKLKLAKINYSRDYQLFKKNVTSQSVVDTDIAQMEETQAEVEASQAKIAQKNITAPFSGFLGINLVNLGDFLVAGNPVVTLQALDPLYVEFSLPEQNLAELYVGQQVDLSLNLPDQKIVSGKITAINSKVDQATRSILVEALVPNTKLALRPGMFALVRVWLRAEKSVSVLPETAIAYSLHGDSVFLVKPAGTTDRGEPALKAVRQYVKTGERRGDRIAITYGIKPGDRVITSGQLKLQNDTRVTIVTSTDND